MTEVLEYRLFKGGYSKMSAQAEESGYSVYCDFMQKLVNTVVFVDASKYTHEVMTAFKNRVSRNLEAAGRSAHFLLILCTDARSNDYIEQVTVAKQVCSDDPFAWIYDESADDLLVPEGQVEEFYGLRRILEDKSVVPPIVSDVNGMGEEREKLGFKEGFKAFVKALPPVTVSLVVINILVYIVCTFTGELLYNKGAVGLSLITSPDQYYRLITSLFLHADATHLFNNMLLLYFAGEITEKGMGSKGYALMYILSGIGGSLLTFFHDYITGINYVVIGASGAVFGVLGSMLALVIFRRLRGRTLQVPRIILVLILSIYSGFRQPGVANFAHIGGLLTGFIFGVIFCIIFRQKGNRI